MNPMSKLKISLYLAAIFAAGLFLVVWPMLLKAKP